LNLLVCEHATSSVARFSEGRREVLASHFEGKELNSPNDIVAASDGAIWFSDPTYGRMPVYGVERSCELDFRGVYRIPAGGGPLQLAVEKGMFTQPNGLCFSPDEKRLYINDTDQANIRVFDVDGGKLKNMRVFASGISDPATPGAPDGMKCDAEGNIWCTGPGGLWVFAPSGELIGKVAVPEFVANHHWGGSGWRTLFITASTSLYALDVKIGPHPESFMRGYI
jgi:gluconolactonase